MCYNDSARLPHLPGARGTTPAEDVILTAADGNRFAAYAAQPAHPARTEIIILPDAGGLRTFYKALARRFAEVGIEAVAFDYYGRSAGLTARDDSFDWRMHAPQLHLEMFLADFTVALACLRAGKVEKRATFAIGFCMGGSLSFWSGTTDLGLAGAIGFYGHVGKGVLLDATRQIKIPLLGLFGDADEFIPVSNVQMFDKQLDDVGVEHQIVIYPGAPHGFFDEQIGEYADDAWQRVLEFITAHTPA